jgi:hypothetical protein
MDSTAKLTRKAKYAGDFSKTAGTSGGISTQPSSQKIQGPSVIELYL